MLFLVETEGDDMNKKLIALLSGALLLTGCTSSAPAKTETPKQETKQEETAQTETKKEESKQEKTQDISQSVFDDILTSLKNDGYRIDKEYSDDDYPGARIYEAEKGGTEYEFIQFKLDADASSAMERIIDEAQFEEDETVDLNESRSQLTLVDKEDGDVTIYALDSNTIVKGSSHSLGSEAMKQQMIDWGFIYGENVTEQDLEKNN